MKPSKCILNCRNFAYPCFCFHSIPLFILFQGEREKKQEKKREGGRGRRRGREGWRGERWERILPQYFDQLKTILHWVYLWETFEKDHKVPVELLIQGIISTSALLMDRSVFLGCLVFIIWTDWNRSHKPFHWFSWHFTVPACMLSPFSHVWLFVTTMDYSLPGFSVNGIFQARVLEWIAISFSRGSSWPRDGIHLFMSPALARGFLTNSAACGHVHYCIPFAVELNPLENRTWWGKVTCPCSQHSGRFGTWSARFQSWCGLYIMKSFHIEIPIVWGRAEIR